MSWVRIIDGLKVFYNFKDVKPKIKSTVLTSIAVDHVP